MKVNKVCAIAILILCLFSAKAFAQEFSLDYGPVYKSENDPDESLLLLSADSSGYLVSRDQNFKKGFVYVDRFDNKNQRVSNSKILLKDKKTDLTFYGMKKIGNNLIVFSDDYDKKKGITKLYGKSFDESGQQIMESTKLDEMHAQTSYYLKFFMAKSEDKKSVRIEHSIPISIEKSKKETVTDYNDQTSVKIFDQNLELISESTINLPFDEDDYSIHSSAKDGDFEYSLVSIKARPEEEGKKKKKTAKERLSGFVVLKYEIKSGKYATASLALAGVRTVGGMSIHAEAGKIYVTGMYSNKTEDFNSGYEGFIFSKLDASTMDVESETSLPFTEGVRSKFFTAKEMKKDISIQYITINNVLHRKNGNSIIMAENAYVWSSSSSQEHHQKNIIIDEVDPSGKLIWSRCIVKHQQSRNDGAKNNSYFPVLLNNKLHILFVDDLKNSKLNESTAFEEPETMDKVKNAGLFDVTIMSNGEMSKQMIVKGRDQTGFEFMKTNMFKTSDNTLRLYFGKDKEFKIATLKLD